MTEPKVYYRDLPQGIKGVYDGRDNEPIIVINQNLTEIEKKCTLAEELIHHEYYPDCNYYRCRNYYELTLCNAKEYRVKKKLALKLIPLKVLKKNILPYLDAYPLRVLAEEVDVTEAILTLRLRIYMQRTGKD